VALARCGGGAKQTECLSNLKSQIPNLSPWIRIGSAWAHADGKGFNIQLETVPLDGRIALRVASEKAK
jgi:hypothetical protein